MKVEDRFDELLRKHCLGTSTREEEAKLERLIAIRRGRNPRSPESIRRDAIHDYQHRKAMKALGAFINRQKSLPSHVEAALDRDLFSLI